MSATVAESEYDPKEKTENEAMGEEDLYTEEEYRRVRRRADFIILPMLMFTNGMCFADKQSLTSSAIFGLIPDTGLKGQQYANLGTFMWMAIGISALPLVWAIQRFPIGKTLSVFVIMWGAMVMLTAACKSYAHLVVVRVFLDFLTVQSVFEAPILPGFAILSTSWYLRSEQTFRQAFYFTMQPIFSLWTAAAIYFLALHVQNTGGMAPWKVINLFLGALTVFGGCINLIFLGTPKEVWWLKPHDKKIAQARIVSNATGGGDRDVWKWSQVIECFTDPQFYIFLLFNILSTIPNGALATFLSLLFVGMGFTPLESTLYSLPMYAINACFAFIPALIQRKYTFMRFPFAIFGTLMSFLAFMFTGLAPATMDKWTVYGVFIFAPSFACSIFLMWPLWSINVAGRTKKSFVSGTSYVFNAVGSIIGTQVMRANDAPKYLKGLTACAVIMMMNVCVMAGWCTYIVWENRRRDRITAAEGLSPEEQELKKKLAAADDLTDRQNLYFRYSV